MANFQRIRCKACGAFLYEIALVEIVHGSSVHLKVSIPCRNRKCKVTSDQDIYAHNKTGSKIEDKIEKKDLRDVPK